MRFQIIQLEDDLIELDFPADRTNLNVFFNRKELEAFRKVVSAFRLDKFSSTPSVGVFSISQDGDSVNLKVDEGGNHSLVLFTRWQWARFRNGFIRFCKEELR